MALLANSRCVLENQKDVNALLLQRNEGRNDCKNQQKSFDVCMADPCIKMHEQNLN